jgi:23S rRNA pseudouridine1911/1915/1917 synthase
MSAPAEPPLRLLVEAADAGQRLDRWLTAQLPDRSRSEVQRWIDHGLVTVGARPGKSGYRLEAGDEITVQPPAPTPAVPLAATARPLAIVYEDDDLLVIDKPAGLVVHPAPGHQGETLVSAVLHHAPQIAGVGGLPGEPARPGIVHRLDKETSGLIVVAKNDRAQRNLQAQFKARTVYKEYLALVEGTVDPPQGRLNAPIGRHPTDRLRQAILPPDPRTGEIRGRPAITDYRTLAYYTSPAPDPAGRANFTLVSAVIHTGRTHQIRVHFAWRKHPVVGDTLYGFRRQRLSIPRQFLHAHRLRFRLPGNGEEREFVAPLPADLQAVLAGLAREAGPP